MSGRDRAGGSATLYAAVALILAAPFLIFADPPLVDLPNHIARQHILFGEGAPGAGTYYAAEWRFIPNLALDGGVYLLHHVMSVEMAVRVFLAATAAQLFLGAVALNRALYGRDAGFPLPACLVIYGGPLLLGFINDCFGIGMALWVIALWLRWRGQVIFIPLLGLLASVILLAHLFAFGVYALVVGACWAGETGRRIFAERAPLRLFALSLVDLIHLAIPVGFAFWLMPGGGNWSVVRYGGWIGKVAAIHALATTGDPIADAVFAAILIPAAILLARRLILAREMGLPLVALAAVFLVLPDRIGQGTIVDFRVPAAFMLILMASLGWRDRADAWRRGATVGVFALFALRLGLLANDWASWQPIYQEYRAAFALLPEGARLLPVGTKFDSIDLADDPPLTHIAALAVSERGAFIPTLFAGLAHELLVYRPPYAALATMTPIVADAAHYDYILVIHPERLRTTVLPLYTPLARGKTFVLGRLLR
jgi:hypothetical protein